MLSRDHEHKETSALNLNRRKFASSKQKNCFLMVKPILHIQLEKKKSIIIYYFNAVLHLFLFLKNSGFFVDSF